MTKIILGLLLSVTLSFGLIYEQSFTQLDKKVLDELNIEASFLKDKKLQKIYNKMLDHSQNHYIHKFENAAVLIPQIKKVLKQNSIPDVFLFMAMAESNFKAQTRSWVGAKGIWQFMPSTGKIYGLKSDLYIDEKLDLVKSTQAATKYLNRLHSMFDKWYLAAFAYNCGEGRVIEAIVRSTLDIYVEQNPQEKKNPKIKNYRKIISKYTQKRSGFGPVYRIYKDIRTWNITPTLEQLLHEQKNLRRQYLPKESRRYLRKIIALAMMSNREYLFSKNSEYILNQGTTSSIVSVKINTDSSLRDIAKLIDIDYEQLKLMNMHVRQDIIPALSNDYNLYIPYEKLALFNAKVHTLKKVKFAFHKVKRGDTLGAIARHYKVPVKLIKKYNKIKGSMIRVKQKLILPVDPYKIKKLTKYTNNKIKRKGLVHIVRNGDTLSAISRKYGIPYSLIKKRNNLRSNALKLKQKLIIPSKV